MTDNIDLSVLHRLRTDLPQDVLLPTPPPIPVPYQVRGALGGDHIGLKLRAADPSPESGDAEKVAEWMSRPHLVETWEQDWPAEKWAADWRAKLSTGSGLRLRRLNGMTWPTPSVFEASKTLPIITRIFWARI